MMLPCLGRLRGTHTTTRVSSPAARSWIFARSLPPPSVSLATTRMVFMVVCGSSLGGWLRVGAGRRRPDVGGSRGAEDAVHRAGDAVLVRAADDGRDLVEVEDRRR